MMYLFEIILGTTLYLSFYLWEDKDKDVVTNISASKAQPQFPLNQ